MVSNPFASDTETSVYAQRTPLIDGKTLNTIKITYSAEVAISGVDDNEMLTNEALPQSFIGKLSRLRTAILNNPDKYPDFKLPNLIINRKNSPNRIESGFPLFWVRRDNIDLDSTWWNIFKELGKGNNNNETRFNDEYWTRDEDDPDINRVPNENFTKLSERSAIVNALNDGLFSPENLVPYELVYPEWFKLHPEYLITASQLNQFGINVSKDLLKPLRESESSSDIDHMHVSFFTGLLPQNESEIKYIFKFFRNIFRDKAFATVIPKQTSPCIDNIINTDGFFDSQGNKLGFINEEGASLGELKSNNYYYQYSARDDDDINLGEIFTFESDDGGFSTELQVRDIFVRKVRGKIKSGKNWEMVVGKGEIYPEFTNFGEVVYPVNPTVTPSPSLATQLNNYNDNVLAPHSERFSNWNNSNLLDYKESYCYISIKLQKGTTKGTLEWDKETVTDLVGTDVDYYEEIIIVNPRIEYRGAYSTAFKSPKAEEIFQNGEYWITNDQVNIKTFINDKYETIAIPGGIELLGIDGEADALAIPVMDSVLKQLVLKDREFIMAKALSTTALAIVRVKVTFLDKNLGTIIQIFFIVVGIIIQNPELISEGITLEALASTIASAFIEAVIFGVVSDIVIDFLVNVVGLEAAGALVTLALAVATIYGVRTDGEFFNDDVFKLVSNFDDSWAELSQEDLLADVEYIEARKRENLRKLEDLKEQTEYLLADKDPNLALQTRVFQIDNESPQQFFSRTIENKNPGVGVYDALATQIDRFKWISHSELPKIATDEQTDDEFIRNLV